MAIEIHFVFNSDDIINLKKVGELGWEVTFDDDRTFRMPNHLVNILLTHGHVNQDADLVDEVVATTRF